MKILRNLMLVLVLGVVPLMVQSPVVARTTESAVWVSYAVDNSLRVNAPDYVKVWLSNSQTDEGSGAAMRVKYGSFQVFPPS